MANTVNRVIIMGNLARDIEMRYSGRGSAFAKSSIALNHVWRSREGEKKEEVSFIDVSFSGKTAEVADEYLRKGDPVHIEGRLRQEKWESDGQKRSAVVVVCEKLTLIGKGRGRDDDEEDRGSRRRRDDDEGDREERGSSRRRSRRDEDEERDEERGSRRSRSREGGEDDRGRDRERRSSREDD
jgi:single-strand DNA-binding protein